MTPEPVTPEPATSLPSETAAPLTGEPCGPDAAWVATFGYGLTCIDAEGWHVYTEASGVIRSNQVDDAATCPDGNTWIATTLGLAVTDGTTWQDLVPLLEYKGQPTALACDGSGGIWFAYFGGVGHIDATLSVTWYDATNLGTGKNVKLVNDVAVAEDGTLWVSTTDSVAQFNGTKWTVYEQGRGFSKSYSFEGLAVDHEGNPWVAGLWGVVTFDGRTWKTYETNALFQSKAVLVDGRDRVWVATYADGVSVWNGASWKAYNRANSGLSSDYTHTLATDSRGRIWIGTEWGLDVLAGSTWTVYHMHTSALLDNEVRAMALAGRGPTLPAPVTKRTGSMTATVAEGGKPQQGLTVEACVEFLGMTYTGETPCSGQPFVKSAVTGTDGRFTIRALPIGRYSLTIQKADGSWVRLTDKFKIGDKETLVTEGGTVDLGELDLAT